MSRRPAIPRPLPAPGTVRVQDASLIYGPCISSLYKMVRDGRLSDVTIGRQRLLLVEELERLIEPKRAAS